MIQYFINIDHQIFILVNQKLSASWMDPIMIFLSSKWMFIPIYIFAVFKMIQLYNKKFWMPMMLCLLAFGLADSISSKIFKPVFKRTRPAFYTEINPRIPDKMPGSKYGFVSSHAANTFAVYPLIAIIVFSVGAQNKASKNRWVIIGYLIAGLVAYSRVYNGVHWPGDVFFGALLGVLIGMFCRFLWYKWLLNKTIES